MPVHLDHELGCQHASCVSQEMLSRQCLHALDCNLISPEVKVKSFLPQSNRATMRSHFELLFSATLCLCGEGFSASAQRPFDNFLSCVENNGDGKKSRGMA